jgi:hypothetical protein
MSPRQMPRVAVLGAGVMGTSTALLLARGGCAVTLVDRASQPMAGASRWNEGKIHLGFLYAADTSTRSAAEMMPGGLQFKPLVEALIGGSISPAVTASDDVYVVHPHSVVDAEAMASHFSRVEALLAEHDVRDYPGPMHPVERLGDADLDAMGLGRGRTAFLTPERSVRTTWIADRLVDALARAPRISVQSNTEVRAVEEHGRAAASLTIACDPPVSGAFDVVINALWEGRLAIDRTAGLEPEPGWSHRYRLALFVDTDRAVDMPNVVLATGPFGDVKNYGGRHFYLSWYPAGLVAEGNDVAPPPIAAPPPESTVAAVKAGLLAELPVVQSVFDAATRTVVAGGWVFAHGRGSLADPSATIHRRDRFGIQQRGGYFSVDTGKYSTAPWLAARLAELILASA